MERTSNRLCPNCGAEMRIKGFSFVCDFCGTHHILDNYITLESIETDSVDIRNRYDYLKRNKQYIRNSNLVTFYDDNEVSDLRSTPDFYANDGHFNRLMKYGIQLSYRNDKQTEILNLVINANQSATIISSISILLDYNVLVESNYLSSDGNSSIFNLGFDSFENICRSRVISIVMDSPDSHMGYYNEFITYCRRFYNLAFNKNKYIYSLNQNLISDYYG